jgi:S-adenosylmethionine:tRNA ribosyltransferase-isomerase
MKTSDFDYYLPQGLIAQSPVEPRDESRLMVLFKGQDRMLHRKFKDIVEFLRDGDVLVLNDTRVIPARLFGRKEGNGANIEVFLLHEEEENLWEVLVRPGRRAKPGTKIVFGQGELVGQVLETTEVGGRRVRFYPQGEGELFSQVLSRIGHIPLPPYIREPLEDEERYQTIYSREPGAVAAPTAGLHFTPELLKRIAAMGVRIATVTLHVGLGTFRPVQVEDIQDHVIHSEYCSVSPEAADTINGASRVIAVGTTVVRTLESAATANGRIEPGHMWTDLFIKPGYEPKVVNGLITNFHLPRSTLLMLVSAFYGREALMVAYEKAIEEGYRFYSFGDAMAIFLK